MKLYCFAALLMFVFASKLITASESPAQYEFHYSVHDFHTGDVKDQFEHRHGDYVTGRYSFIEPDGHLRVVDYSADPISGFTAEVRRELSPLVRHLQRL